MRRKTDLTFVLFLCAIPVAIAVGCAKGATFDPSSPGDGGNGGSGANGGSGGTGQGGDIGNGGAGAHSNQQGGAGGQGGASTTTSGGPSTTTSGGPSTTTSGGPSTTSVTSVTSTTAVTSGVSSGAGGASSACDGTSDCGTCADCADNDASLCLLPYFDCSFDDNCVNLANCLASCAQGDDVCINNCASTYQAGIDYYNAWVTCVVCTACYSDCDGAGSGC